MIFVILISVVILSYVIVIQTWIFNPENPSLIEGDVAQQDLRAPRNIEYVSDVLTDQARDDAERAVEPVYGSPDPQISRGQLEILQSVLDAVTGIRQDATATQTQKIASLQNIQYYQFSQEALYSMLALSSDQWDMVRQEASKVLESVMRNPIRTDTIDATLNSLFFSASRIHT